jgi:glycosyltransferase involved in cell wall biosynthesis
MNEKIRVGLLTPTLLFGGAERWVATLAVGLDPTRFHVVGVAIRDAGKLFPAIADKVTRRCPISYGPASFATLARDCDVLIAWGLPDLAMLSGFRGRVVYVGHGHCEWSVNCIRSSAAYVTDWAAVSQHAADSFPDPSRVTVIHNGIDTDRCIPERSREMIRAAWGIGPGEIAVGYVGRMSSEKNPLAAVETVQWLRVEGRESRASRLSALDSGLSSLDSRRYRAVLVGDGPGRKFFLERARTMVRDVVYQLPVENVGDIFRALDCFVLASRFEGFSLALAEAWYCACPTVATPVGATELADLHGRLHVRVPVGCSPRELARAVCTAISPENRATVAHAAEVVATHYTAKAMCRRWERHLESMNSPASNT